MNEPKYENAMLYVAFAFAAGSSIALILGVLLLPGAMVVRLGLLVLGIAASGAVVAAYLRHNNHANRVFSRYIETLCQSAAREEYGANVEEKLPSLTAEHPLSHEANKVREALLRLCRKVQDLEHTQTVSRVHNQQSSLEDEHIRTIFDGLFEPIILVDDYEEIVLANKSAHTLFELEHQDPAKRSLANIAHCEKLLELLSSISRRTSVEGRTDELEICDSQGNSHWYRATACKIPGLGHGENSVDTGTATSDRQSSKRERVVAILRDIGEQKAIRKRNAEFVSAVSHEMKTPLAGIKAYVELLADGDVEDEETREEFLQVINGQADRLQRLIENMLNLARIEAGVVRVNKQAQSLNEIMEEALHVVQPSAESKQITLSRELSAMYLGVLVDRDMMLQVAINLLSNAIKYTPEGGSVILRSRMIDHQIQFSVEDTGVGLSEEDRQRVFEKFYRVNKDKTMAAGTGLGLPLAKHIVEDVHGGEVSVESEPSKGSTFIVTLPGAAEMNRMALTP